MKVSVIILIDDNFEYLDETLASLMTQTFYDTEFICLANRAIEIIDKYRLLDKRFKSYILENKDKAYMRNYGIEKSSGEYLSFIEANDIADRKMLEASLFYIDRFNLDLFIFGIKDKENKSINGVYNISEDPKLLAYLDTSLYGKVYKKDLFIKNNLKFIDIKYTDLALVPLTLIYSKKIGYSDRVLYEHRNKEIKVDDSIYDIFKATDTLIDFFLKNEIFDKYYDELEHLIDRAYKEAIDEVESCSDKNFVYKFIDRAFKEKGKNFKKKNRKYRLDNSIYHHKLLLKWQYKKR